MRGRIKFQNKEPNHLNFSPYIRVKENELGGRLLLFWDVIQCRLAFVY